jgi:hypothetical protein
VRGNDPFADRKAQARSLAAPHRAIELPESLEDALALVLRDAGPFVPDLDAYARRLLIWRGGDGNSPPAFGKTCGILD